MSQYNYGTAPNWVTNTAATASGWTNSDTGEILVAIGGLDTIRTDIASLPTFTAALSGGKGKVTIATSVEGVLNTTQEVQTVTVTGALSGTWTLTIAGQTTSALAYNISTAALQAALEALSGIGAGNVVVSGSVGSYTLTYSNTLGNVATPTANVTNLAGNVTFVTGNVITITVTPSESVTVDLIPYIGLTINGVARQALYDKYSSSSTSLVFKYTVVAGDSATAGQFTIGTSMLTGFISDNLPYGGAQPMSSGKTFSAITTTSVTIN